MTPSGAGGREQWLLRAQQRTWQPAILLIFAQLASGLRDMSQFAFFLIYLPAWQDGQQRL